MALVYSAEPCCTGSSSEWPPSLPVIDGTPCLEKQQCQGGSVFHPMRLSIMKAAYMTLVSAGVMSLYCTLDVMFLLDLQ
jgi:hypothetical protein